MKSFLIFVVLFLPVLAIGQKKTSMELSSQGRKLRATNSYSQENLPVEALKEASALFPGEPMEFNITLDDKGKVISTRGAAHYSNNSSTVFITKGTVFFPFCFYNDVLWLHRLEQLKL
jgi:hypothetical protein